MRSWFAGWGLRRRIAVSVGLFASLVVLIFGATSWFLVGRSLQSTTDADLRATAEAIVNIGAERFNEEGDTFNGADPFGGDGSFGDGPLGQDGGAGGFGNDVADMSSGEGRPPLPYFQLLDNEGASLFGELPVSEEAMAVALGNAAESIESIEQEGRTIRVLTVELGAEEAGALRVGTDITNTVNGLRRARDATSVAVLLAGLSTAAMAWLLSRHLIAPVTAVAEAADLVRRDHELPERLDGEGSDELGRLVTSFNAMLDDVRHSREQQRRLIADASHELRTPLTSLRIKVEFVQSQPDLGAEERQRLLDGAVAELESLGLLVTELVELASEGATPERPQLVELADVVTAETQRFRTTSGRTVEVETTPGLVETRPKQTTRALTNLLVNADKYSPEGEPITVRQRGPRIEVIDRGPGIPPADRARVFDRFYRGRSHQSIDGSGLGLAIVESVAKANGGTVWVDDPGENGRGTIVGFSVGPGVDTSGLD